MAPAMWFCVLACVSTYLGQVNGQYQYPDFKDLDSNLYSNTGTIPAVCFRLTNDTHQIGCSAGISNVQGNVYYVSSEDDLTRLLSGDAPYPPYVAFVDGHNFTTQAALTNGTNLLAMKQSDRVVGVVIAHITSNNNTGSGSPDSPYSPLHSCDNSGFGWSGSDTCSVDWNPFHQDFLFYDFGDFPIMAITTEDDFSTIYNCWLNFSSDNSFPLCSLEMKADMQSAVDTETCFRRQYIPMAAFIGARPRCEALGDYSPWGTPFALPEKNKSVVMVTTKLDSLSLFPSDLSLGGGEAAGIVVLLAAAEAIGRLKREGQLMDTNSTIFFTLFHGESWDYIGSSRMVHDMDDTVKPGFKYFTPQNISYYIELSHVGIVDASQSTFFAHMNREDTGLFKTLAEFASEEGLLLNQAKATVLPPSSVLRFLRKNPNITAAVLGDYDEGYKNRFYGSRFDDINNLAPDVDNTFEQSLNATAERLAALSTVVARTLLTFSGPQFEIGSNVSNTSANASLVKDLIKCFLQDYSCPAFLEVSDPGTTLKSGAVSRYIGVWRPNSPNMETTVTQNLLSYYLGVRSLNRTKDNCTNVNCTGNDMTYSSQGYVRGSSYNSSVPTSGLCVCSNTGRYEALSPAFSTDGTSYNREMAGEFSSWAESWWNSNIVRVYITAGVGHDVGVFLGGVCVFALSVLLSIQLYRKGRRVFLLQTTPTVATN